MEIADQIDTVGKVHLLLAQSTRATVQLALYLKELCKRLTGALAPAAISLDFDCPADFPLRPEKALARLDSSPLSSFPIC